MFSNKWVSKLNTTFIEVLFFIILDLFILPSIRFPSIRFPSIGASVGNPDLPFEDSLGISLGFPWDFPLSFLGI